MANFNFIQVMVTVNLVLSVCIGSRLNEECFVYSVPEEKTDNFTTTKKVFHVDYLKLSEKDDTFKSQIHIHFLNDGVESGRHLQIFISKTKYVNLRDEKEFLARSSEPLIALGRYPARYSFKIKIENQDFKVFRFKHMRPIVSKRLSYPVNASSFRVQIDSSHQEFVTFNCMTDCPIYRDYQNFLSFELNSSMTINTLWQFSGEGQTGAKNDDIGNFTLGLASGGDTGFNHSVTHSSENPNSKITIRIDDTELWLLIDGNQTNTIPRNDNSSFRLTIYNSSNVLWAVECDKFHTVAVGPSRNRSTPRGGRALIPKNPKPQPNKPLDGNGIYFTVGEVAAWVIAALSLCGLLVVGLTLYMKVSRAEWEVEEDRGVHLGMSVSHVGNFEMLPYPKHKKSVFYAEIRKPDEGIEPSRPRTSKVPDFLYPLDLSMDNITSVDVSDQFGTTRSCDTIVTNISTENR